MNTFNEDTLADAEGEVEKKRRDKKTLRERNTWKTCCERMLDL